MNDLEFWGLFIMICDFDLSTREMKYLLWRFYSNKSSREIAKEEKVSFQAVHFIMNRAYIKIKAKLISSTTP